MAGPFHYYLRRDSVGEGKADEGSSGCVGSYEFVFGVDFIYSLSGMVTGSGNWGVEPTEFTQILEVLVHLLV